MRFNCGKELGLGDADVGVGRDELLLQLHHVRAPLEEGRRQPGRHGGRDGLGEQRRAARNGGRVLPEERADLVFLRGDLALQLRDGGGRRRQRTLGPRHLQLGLDAELEPVLEDAVDALVRGRRVAGDLEPGVELDQLEIRLGHVADERQQDAAASLLGGEELRGRRLVRPADGAPDVDLPARRERPEEEVRRGRVELVALRCRGTRRIPSRAGP